MKIWKAALLLAAGVGSAAWAGEQDFVLLNNTGETIEELYVAPSSSDEWEEDVLGRDVLAEGERTRIEFPRRENACLWDLKVTYDDDTSSEWQGINLCETSVVALSYDRRTGKTWADFD